MTSQNTADLVAGHPDLHRPDGFTQNGLGWVPWLEPLPAAEFEERHWNGLIDRARAEMPYFALLAREPEVLAARTLTDFDIFGNEEGGLPLAERELAATAVSRVNGCVFCASVHSRNATKRSGRGDDVQALLTEGVTVRIDERWDALIEAARALTVTPNEFGAEHIIRLTALGLTDLDIADAIAGSAFFNWANRLMLSLGEPEVPASRSRTTS